MSSEASPVTLAATFAADNPPVLRAWLDQANDQHPAQPAATAIAMTARAASLPADAEGAEAVRLAEHVWLGHLGDTTGFAAFINRLPATLATAEATAPSLQRAHWALATLAGQPAPAAALPLADAPRWRALQNVLLAMAAQGRSEAAAALLLADEPLALAHGADDAGKAFASTANNVAGHLQEGLRGDATRDALMLQAAAVARRAWASAGTWMQVERADYRLAHCHAVAGQGVAAVEHARRCLLACEAAGDQADALEHFFAHEALVAAHRAAADAPAAAAALQRMRTLLADIPVADGLQAWCAKVLADLPTEPPG